MINFSNLDKPAIITKNITFTYRDFIKKINSYSKVFEGKKYKHVAILSENRAEWIFAFYAAWKNSCVVIPIDFMASPSEVAHIIDDCKPELIFTSNKKETTLSEALSTTEHLPDVCTFENLKNTDAEEDLSPWKYVKDQSQTAVIIYTSGTTGTPKGVMLSYTNLIINVDAVSTHTHIYDSTKQILIYLPLHHVFPLLGSMITPLYVGATIVMSPSIANADLSETLKNNTPNIMIGVPRLYEAMYKGIKAKIEASFIGKLMLPLILKSKARWLARVIFKKVQEGFGGNLEFMISGGAALPKHICEFFYCLGFSILEGYGMTEAAPMVSFTRPNNIVPGSIGEKLLGTEIKILDGEILVKGPNVMQGYFNRPEETADIIKKGWLHTGDLGRIDDKGLMFITGRKKEIIVLSNGKNINPAEVEEKFKQISDCVSDAAVTIHNQKLHAIIVPNMAELAKKAISNFNEHFKSEILKHYNELVGSSKKIMRFTITNSEIPRTRLGKIQRFKLDKLIEEPVIENKKESEPNYEEYKIIKEFIEKESNIPMKPNDHLGFDIDLDSLAKLSLIDFIERSFGVKINESQLLKFPSVIKMVEFVKDNKLRHRIEKINWSAILKENVQVELPKSSIIHIMFKNASKVFFKLYFRFKSKGIENIPDGPCIIAPNHQSFFDGMFVASNIKNKVLRKTYFYAKQKHVNNKALRLFARKNNIIIMDINDNLKESILKLAKVLRMGRKIIIFPEGTRTTDGSIGEFKKTFAILSKELNVPIIPVAIKGANKALPIGKVFPKLFCRVQVNFLQPLNAGNHSYESLSKLTRNQIEREINR